MSAAAGSLFELKFLRAACLSGDGRHVAYSVSRTTDGEERFQIIVADLQTHDHRILGYAGNATAPRWSPDGRAIAFFGDQRLHIAEFPSLQVLEPLTPGDLAARGTPSWSPDGSRVAVTLMRRRALDGASRVRKSVFRADGLGDLDELHQGIYQVSVSERTLGCLTPGESFCSRPEWSPCGRRVLFFACDDAISFASYSQRLLTVDVEAGGIETVLAGEWHVESAQWLPEGDRIAISGGRVGSLPIPVASLWVIDRYGRNAELRTPQLAGNVGLRINHDMPAREIAGGNPCIVLDSRTAYASVQKGGRGEVWRIALAGDIACERVLGGDRSCIALDVHRASGRLLFATTDLHRPLQLSCTALEGFGETPLTDLNVQELARWPPLRVEPFCVQTGDGYELDAWFVARADSALPLPTVLFIHAGPFAATGQAFRYDFHLLAAQGFGVVFANFRGSAGYGEAFAQGIVGDWGRRGFADHMATVDAAVARGYADSSRLGVWGASHGGFATCWIVCHTNRFKAAVAEASITDFTSLYYTTDAPAVFARDLGGTPREISEVYRDRSPLTRAHRCTTPTLLIHGKDDLRCPIAQAEAFHRALIESGCTTELVRIPRCSHSGDSIGPLSARAAQNEALVEWFQRYL